MESAVKAGQELLAMTSKERGAILRRWFDLTIAARDDLAVIITAENGKPLAEAQGEITYAADFLDWFAGVGRRIDGMVGSSVRCSRGRLRFCR